jgi:hypothetical protein
MGFCHEVYLYLAALVFMRFVSLWVTRLGRS